MNLTKWIHRHRRVLMAASGSVLIMAWLLLPVLGLFRRNEMPTVGSVAGRGVTARELEVAQRALNLGQKLGMLDVRTYWALAVAKQDPVVLGLYAALAGPFREFVSPEQERLATDAPWRVVALMHAAREAGVVASPAESMALLSAAPSFLENGTFSQERYTFYLGRYGFSDAEAVQIAGVLAEIAKLIRLHETAVGISRAEDWMDFTYRSEQARMRYVRLPGALFQPLVKSPDDEALLAFYEEHKGQQADPATGTVGYTAPERARVEYAEVTEADVTPGIEVTDDQIGAYYEANKQDRYALPSDSYALQSESPAAGEAAPRYRSLESVRDEIREALLRQQVREAALTRIEAVMTAVHDSEARYGGGALPLGQMARRYGLRAGVFRTGDGRELLTREELAALEPAGAQVVATAFDDPTSLFIPTRVAGPGGVYLVVQVLERREAEQQPFEEARDQVRRDLIAQSGLASAAAFGGTLKARAQEIGLAAAAAEFETRLRNLLRDAGVQAPSGDVPLLAVTESEPFARSARTVPGVEGAALDLVHAAFTLGEGQAGLVEVGRPMEAAFVVEAFGRQAASAEDFDKEPVYAEAFRLRAKRERLISAWLQSLLPGIQPRDQVGG